MRAAALLLLLTAPAIPSLRMNPGPPDNLRLATFDITGLDPADLTALRRARWSDDDWPELYRVTLDRAGSPPLPGTYAIAGRALRFAPREPLESGARYRVRFDPSRLPGRGAPASGPIEALFAAPP